MSQRGETSAGHRYYATSYVGAGAAMIEDRARTRVRGRSDLSFLSPCCLPGSPGYLSLTAGHA